MLRKLLPSNQTAAEFTDETLRVGIVKFARPRPGVRV